MNGLYFLWLMWAVWIISTFLLNKNNGSRLWCSAVSLILIISFPYGVTLPGLNAGLTSVLIFLLCMLFIRNCSLPEKLYLFISSFIIGMSYSSFKLLAFYDPIIMIVDEKIMVTAILLVVSFLLYSDVKQVKKRLLTLGIGLITGEFITGIVFMNNYLPYQIGGHLFLDVISISAASGVTLHLLQLLSNTQSSIIKTAFKKGEVRNL
ncbi:MAG: YphA family membrane protein [Bacillota bacterium]